MAARACAARRSRARRPCRTQQAARPRRAASSREPRRADAVGGELGAQVGEALVRAGASAPRAPSMAASSTRRGSITTPSSASVCSRRASSPASGRRRRRGGRGSPPSRAARRRRRAARPAVMSGRWVPPRNGSLSTHRSPARRAARRSTAATAAGIEPRWTGMCSACITISPLGVEQRRRAVAALLDVRRVRRADQDGAHLVAGARSAAGEHLQLDRVDGTRHRCAPCLVATIVPTASTSAVPAAGDEERGLGQLEDARPVEREAGRRLAGDHLDRQPARPANRRAARRPARLRAVRRRRLEAGRGSTAARRTLTSSTHRVRRGTRSVARARRRRPRSARPARRRAGRRRAARTTGRGSGARRSPPARPLLMPSASRVEESRRRGSRPGQLGAARASPSGWRRGGAPRQTSPSAESTPAERGQRTRSMPSSSAIAAAWSGPAPPNGSSAKPARVDAALDRDHAQRPDHLLVGDRRMPSAASIARARARSASAPTAASAAARSSVTPPASPASGSRWPSSRLASVTVGSLAALAVAGGPGLGAGRARPDPQRAALVAPGDRAAAGADRVDVDHRQLDRPAVELAALGPADAASLDDADVAGGAAHVEAERVAAPRRARPAGRRRPPRRPGR